MNPFQTTPELMVRSRVPTIQLGYIRSYVTLSKHVFSSTKTFFIFILNKAVLLTLNPDHKRILDAILVWDYKSIAGIVSRRDKSRLLGLFMIFFFLKKLTRMTTSISSEAL